MEGDEETFEPDYEPEEPIPENDTNVRFLPKMCVRIKAIKGISIKAVCLAKLSNKPKAWLK